jgi:hypothetical protein
MIRLSAAHTGKDSHALPSIDTSMGMNGHGHTNETPDQTASAITNGTTPTTPRVFQPPTPGPAPPATAIKTRLATSSMISYFNDRILTPEMMRAMIILYVGPHHRPDFSTDFLLSPLLAPESLLARFPRTWMLTGERDPLVDDTVIFAGRLRQAKRAEWMAGKELGLEWARGAFREEDWVNVDLIPGISHGFLQFVSVFPDGWKYISRCAKWIDDALSDAPADAFSAAATPAAYTPAAYTNGTAKNDYFGSGATAGLAETVQSLNAARRARHHTRSGTVSSADEDWPLEMTVLSKSKSKASPPASSATATATPSGSASAPLRRVANGDVRGRGRVRRSERGRRKSLVRLASEDDLLGRRMKGLTGGLGGEGI